MSDLNATAAALLGLLHDGPKTGGQLVAEAGDRFGAFFSVTRSQVYRELPALADLGLLGHEDHRKASGLAQLDSRERIANGWLVPHSHLGQVLECTKSAGRSPRNRAEAIGVSRA